jgi:replication initiation protein RepC
MTTRSTTPFGRRSTPLGLIATQIETRAFAEKSGRGKDPVHKWHVFRALSETCRFYGISDRSLTVLHALLTFHPETALSLEADNPTIVVFPSSRELETRANGMPPSTLRRHLASLVAAGLIVRRDSPNGKRYARKTSAGEIGEAFGFDIAPLVARAAEIEARAAERRAELRERALLREKISILRRDAAALIATGMETKPGHDWEALTLRLRTLAAANVRNATAAALGPLARDLEGLAIEVESALDVKVDERKMSAKDSQNERHIQIQTPEKNDFEPASDEAGSTGAASPEPAAQPERARAPFPLPTLLSAFPTIRDYAPKGIQRYADFVAAAEAVRPMLGVSPDAWRAAVDTMGKGDAAIAVAAILQRADAISSPGGYLRALTAKAGQGAFATGPVVIAQLKANLKSRATRSGDESRSPS